MFDTFMSLPLHVLVLHFTVVLLPIGAAATMAVILRPAWRARFAHYVAAGNVALLALTFVTVRAGFALKHKLNPDGEPGGAPTHDHQEYAEVLLWVMVALAVLSVLTWLATRMDGLPPVAITSLAGLVAVLAVVSIGYTVITGHTGTESHWGSLYGK